MLENFKNKVFRYFLYLLIPLLAACAGTTGAGSNLAAPPAPLAELPNFLTIPSSVEIDTSKTASSPGSVMAFDQANQANLALMVVKDAVGPGIYGGAISFAANVSRFAHDHLNSVLLPLNAIQIPVEATRHHMDTVISIGSVTYTVHLDFRDFDIDGNGVSEGCSGNTAQLPICVRAWIFDFPLAPGAYTKFFAARFDAFPTESNPGAGQVRGHDLNLFQFQVRADYDHVDPENKFTDVFMGLIFDPDNPTNPDPSGPDTGLIARFRAFVSQLGPDATALKTANGTSPDFELSGPGFRGSGFGRWLEDKDFWLGSFESDDPLFIAPQYHFSNLCALISTGDAAGDQGICGANGLKISDLDFLPAPVKEDVQFFDFPAAPPP